MIRALQIFLLLCLIACKSDIPTEPIFEYEIREGLKKESKPPLLILLHGYGSNEDDLFKLSERIDRDYTIVSVRAPYAIEDDKFKWYDLKITEFPFPYDKNQAEKSRQDLLLFIKQLKKMYDFDEDKIIISGFSQGAIMSYYLCLTKPDIFDGTIALGGMLLDDPKVKVKSHKNLKDLEVLIIHGKKDQMIPVEYAAEANKSLMSLGIDTEYSELDLGHSINYETIRLMNDWLGRMK